MKNIYIDLIDMTPGFDYDRFSDVFVPLLASTLRRYAASHWSGLFGRRKSPTLWTCAIRIVSSHGHAESTLRGPDVSWRLKDVYYAMWLRDNINSLQEYACDVLRMTSTLLLSYGISSSHVDELVHEVCLQAGVPEAISCVKQVN